MEHCSKFRKDLSTQCYRYNNRHLVEWSCNYSDKVSLINKVINLGESHKFSLKHSKKFSPGFTDRAWNRPRIALENKNKQKTCILRQNNDADIF